VRLGLIAPLALAAIFGQPAPRTGGLTDGDWTAHGFTESQRIRVRKALQAGVSERWVPGGALLIAHRGEVIFREAVGAADAASGRPFTVGTPARIGSITKSYTATLLAMLVERGKLAWDDPVDRYVPAFREPLVRGKPQSVVPTIRQLLCHTAGLPTAEEVASGEFRVSMEGPLAHVVDLLGRQGLARVPGTVYAYNSQGYMVAGRIAEVVTGEQFDPLLRRLLLDPIGATVTTFRPSDELRRQLPPLVDRRDGGFEPADPSRHPETLVKWDAPGGALISTLDDVARFLLLHRNRGSAGGRRVVKAETLSELYHPQPLTPDPGYGLGFAIARRGPNGAVVRVRHSGAYGTLAVLDFEQDLIVVLLTQVPLQQTEPFRQRLMQAVDSVFGS